MSSPFRVFRKHQKWLLVVAGLTAMFAFVLADPITSFIQGSRGVGAADPVATSAYGTIDEQQISTMVQMRSVVASFVMQAVRLGIDAGGRPKTSPIGRHDPMYVEELIQGQRIEQTVVEDMLKAKKAEELGFVVSDEVINEYLRGITGDALRPGNIRNLISKYKLGNRGVSVQMVFDALRQDLLVEKLERRFGVPFASPPGQAWDYYRRLNDVVQVELLPVPVENYISDVQDPSPEVLAKFFDEYRRTEKARYRIMDVVMDGPEPGFKQPRRAAFAAIKLDANRIIVLNAAEVTDQEVADYYADNKSNYEVMQLLESETDEEDTPTGEPSNDEPSNDEPSNDEPNNDDPKIEDSTTDDPASEVSTSDEPAADETEGDVTEGREATEPKEDKEAVPATSSQGETNEPNEASPIGDSDGQFNVVEEDADDAAASDTTSDNPVDDENGAEAEGEGAAPDADSSQPAATNAASADAASADAASNDTPANESSEQAPDAASETPGEATSETPAPAVKYQPLEEVADEIRRIIASYPDRMQTRREELLGPIMEAMSAFETRHTKWIVAEGNPTDDEPRTPPPTQPDVKQMAADAGLTFEETEMLSYLELNDTALGRSRLLVDGRPSNEALAAHAFVGRMVDFRPVMTVDGEDHSYAVWRTAEKQAYEPELKDVRAQVVRAWKMIEARELAKKDAELLAQKARESKQPLREHFSERKDPPLLITEPFTWLTFGPVPAGQFGRSPRLSTIDGVDGAGPEFMRAIYSLQDDDVGVAVNYPQTVAYVARIARHDVPLETLRTRFLESGEAASARFHSSQELNGNLYASLREGVISEANLQWVREPDARRQ